MVVFHLFQLQTFCVSLQPFASSCSLFFPLCGWFCLSTVMVWIILPQYSHFCGYIVSVIVCIVAFTRCSCHEPLWLEMQPIQKKVQVVMFVIFHVIWFQTCCVSLQLLCGSSLPPCRPPYVVSHLFVVIWLTFKQEMITATSCWGYDPSGPLGLCHIGPLTNACMDFTVKWANKNSVVLVSQCTYIMLQKLKLYNNSSLEQSGGFKLGENPHHHEPLE